MYKDYEYKYRYFDREKKCWTKESWGLCVWDEDLDDKTPVDWIKNFITEEVISIYEVCGNEKILLWEKLTEPQ